MSQQKRVAIAEKFGGPEEIAIQEQQVPDLPAHNIRVAVRTVGMNQYDAHRRAGGFDVREPVTFGGEFAGVIVESRARGWEVGEEVIGWGVSNAAADLVDTDGTRLVRKPTDLDWSVAGALSTVGQVALSAIRSVELGEGDIIVVHGAAGAAGTVLVQLARKRGVTVIGTASEQNHDYLRALGAIPVAHGENLAADIEKAAEGDPVKASIDLTGHREAGEYAVALAGEGGAAITLLPETHASHGVPMIHPDENGAQMLELLSSVQEGSLQLTVETLSFEDIVEAHRRLDSGEARGKLVLELSDNPYL